jgi:hypothetical protein
MTDIVDRLRGLSISGTFGPLELREHQIAEAQAADEIARLRQAVLRIALTGHTISGAVAHLSTECICPKCGLRHGGDFSPAGF